jgi:hypothetical protein
MACVRCAQLCECVAVSRAAPHTLCDCVCHQRTQPHNQQAETGGVGTSGTASPLSACTRKACTCIINPMISTGDGNGDENTSLLRRRGWSMAGTAHHSADKKGAPGRAAGGGCAAASARPRGCAAMRAQPSTTSQSSATQRRALCSG